MSKAYVTLVVGMLGTLLAVPALSAPPGLHVNVGLWEISMTSATSGRPPMPPEALAQIPPARRAQMMATMRAAMGPQSHTIRNCVTQKDLDRPFRPMSNPPDTKCTQTVTSASATMQDIRYICTGSHPSDGHFQFEATTPGTMKGQMTMTMGEGAHMMHVNAHMNGRWLGADCGSVRPAGGG